MTSTIKIKNSSTAGAVPGSGDLVQGELAVNVTDKKIYTKNASGTVVNLGTTPSITDNGNAEAIVIDSSENVGIGVSPSSWGTGYKVVDINTYGALVAVSSWVGIAGNNYYNGTNWIYKTTGYSSLYQQAAGQHIWLNSASGTAGNTISFTQAMTLDASGNLGIGTTSPSVRLHAKTGSSGALSDSRYIVTAEGGSEAYLCASAADYAGIRFPNASSASQAYIDYTHGTNYMSFGVNNGERVRIDSSGNLLVGTTSTLGASGVLQLLGSMDAQAVTRCSAASAGQYWRYGADSGNSFIVYSSNASGGVYIGNASTSWSGRSDERLKDIIEPITDAANKVSSLRAVIGKFKTDEEGTRRSFLIAQDVQAVLPEAVSVSPRKEGEETDYLGVAYTEVIPLLVAAIKEQQAIIESLTARITALEA